jgi:toxin ParE1/3/4
VSDRKYRLTELADGDIDGILDYTHQNFGHLQRDAYQALIEQACQMVGEDPMRKGSKTRDELGQGVRSLHVSIAARRKGAASHILYYIAAALEDGTPGAVVLRILWDGMEPMSYVAFGLDELE